MALPLQAQTTPEQPPHEDPNIFLAPEKKDKNRAPKDGPLQYFANIKTSMGKIKVRLFADKAPRSVINFVELARGEKEFQDARTSKKTRRPFYSGLLFHRVIKGFLIQTGCPFGNGRGGPGYTMPDEVAPDMVFDRPGLMAMANLRDARGAIIKDTAGSQFFITLREAHELDGKMTIIGEVTEGMPTVQKIAAIKTGPTERPLTRIYLHSIEITEK